MEQVNTQIEENQCLLNFLYISRFVLLMLNIFCCCCWDATRYISGLMTTLAAPLQTFVRGGAALPEVTFRLALSSFVQSVVIVQPFARPAKNASLLLSNALLPSLRTRGFLSYLGRLPNSSLSSLFLFIFSLILHPWLSELLVNCTETYGFFYFSWGGLGFFRYL